MLRHRGRPWRTGAWMPDSFSSDSEVLAEPVALRSWSPVYDMKAPVPKLPPTVVWDPSCEVSDLYRRSRKPEATCYASSRKRSSTLAPNSSDAVGTLSSTPWNMATKSRSAGN